MTVFEAGFGRVDITPPIGSTASTNEDGDQTIIGVHWPLNARAAIFRSGADTVMFIACDLIALEAETVQSIRTSVAAAIGIDRGAIVVSCTHTHSGAQSIAGWGGREPDRDYLVELVTKVTAAARTAQSDLAPCTLHVGSADTSGLTFNRRPLYRGREVGNEGPQWVEDFEALEGPADEALQLLYAVREDGRFAGGLADFAVHPHMFGLEPVYSADLAGAFVTKLGARLGGEFLFLQGASGNLYWRDMSKPPFWTPEGGVKDPTRRMRTVAPWGELEVGEWGPIALADAWSEALVDAALRAIGSGRAVKPGPIRYSKATLSIAQRRPKPEHLEAARWLKGQDFSSVDVDEYNMRATGHRYTFYANQFLQRGFADQILSLDALQRAAGHTPIEDEVEIMTISIGDVGFATYPAEMFTEFGLGTKSDSPYADTFVIELANGWVGYIPTLSAFDHGGYETRIAIQSRLAPQAGDEMTAEALRQLQALHRADDSI